MDLPTRATLENTSNKIHLSNLFLPVPDTDVREYLAEVDELAGFAPEIIAAIDNDLDARAREKKFMRLTDSKFIENQTGDLPEFNITECDILAQELGLGVGRPRMSGYPVYLFLMLHASRISRLVEFPARPALSSRIDELARFPSVSRTCNSGMDNHP